MSHHTSLCVKYSGTSINFPPVQSCFELSLGKASSDAAGGDIFRNLPSSRLVCYWDLVSRNTCFLCILYEKHSVAIGLWCLEKKNQRFGPLLHPLPSPCLTLPDCTRSLITSQILKAITSSFFVRFVWNFHTSF